jgi:polar amino acid transport system permease protein
MRTFGFPEFLFILEAAKWTVALSMIAFIGGAIGGLVIALSRTSDNAAARVLSGGFIQIFQGTLLLLQLFRCFGAGAGLDINPGWRGGADLVSSAWAKSGAAASSRARHCRGGRRQPVLLLPHA